MIAVLCFIQTSDVLEGKTGNVESAGSERASIGLRFVVGMNFEVKISPDRYKHIIYQLIDVMHPFVQLGITR
jgi:hypothetical protein